jgi:hypothetical protein
MKDEFGSCQRADGCCAHVDPVRRIETFRGKAQEYHPPDYKAVLYHLSAAGKSGSLLTLSGGRKFYGMMGDWWNED